MISEKKEFETVSSDSSYGGSTYRLSYDRVENKKSRKRSSGLKTALAVVISIVLLFVFAYLALRHYDDAIQKLYASETTPGDGNTEADLQSSVNIVK